VLLLPKGPFNCLSEPAHCSLSRKYEYGRAATSVASPILSDARYLSCRGWDRCHRLYTLLVGDTATDWLVPLPQPVHFRKSINSSVIAGAGH
jgi:hypothetical protein